MPRLDGTGPQGQGPMTGGGRGNCNKRYRRNLLNEPENVNQNEVKDMPTPQFGPGLGFKRRFRRGNTQ